MPTNNRRLRPKKPQIANQQASIFGPGQWTVMFDLHGESEGENYRIEQIMAALQHLLRENPAIEQLTREMVTEVKTLSHITVPHIAERATHLVKQQLKKASPAIEALVQLEMIRQLCAQAGARNAAMKCAAHLADPPLVPLPPELESDLHELSRHRPDETASEYERRQAELALCQKAWLNFSRGIPLSAGRKPRTEKAGQGLPRYIRHWYEKRWEGRTHYQMNSDSTTRKRIREVDRLLRLVTPWLIRQDATTYFCLV